MYEQSEENHINNSIKKPRIAGLFLSSEQSLFPKSLGQRKTRQRFRLQTRFRFDAAAFEHGRELARVLCRVPGRAFIEHIDRLHTKKGFHLLLAGLVVELVPPLLQSCDDALAITCDFVTRGEGAFCRRHIGELNRIFDAVYNAFEKGFANAEDVMAHQTDRAVAVGDHAFIQCGVG